MINDWNERPSDYRRLLNPAFCGLLITRAVKDYEDLASQGMPLALCFLVLPMVIPTYLRDALPTVSTTSLPRWIHENPFIRVGLAHKARSLGQITRESLLFYLQRGALSVGEGEFVSAVPRKVSATGLLELEKRSSSLGDLVEKARFVGRWFARSGEPTTIFFLLGIRP